LGVSDKGGEKGKPIEFVFEYQMGGDRDCEKKTIKGILGPPVGQPCPRVMQLLGLTYLHVNNFSPTLASISI